MAALHQRAITPAWPISDMRHHLETDLCLGTGSPLQAFIILRPIEDQAEILTLVTDPAKRQIGLARAILQSSEKMLRAKNIEIIFLEVAEDNAPAIALYKSCSFEPFGRRPAYYRRDNGRVAALTFRKRLDASA